jgi:hypothetical protein
VPAVPTTMTMDPPLLAYVAIILVALAPHQPNVILAISHINDDLLLYHPIVYALIVIMTQG